MHIPSGLLFRFYDADRGLRRAERRGARRFATAWVRGLGDVPFIVGEFVRHVRGRIPDAEVSVLVRPGLEQACRWIEGVRRVVVVEDWTREQTLTSRWGLAFPPPWEIRRALAARNLIRECDAILAYPLGRWYDRDPLKRRPRLVWTDAERAFGRTFIDRAFPDPARFVITLDTQIGTAPYYDFNKEWGAARFAVLITSLLRTIPDCRLILVDAKKAGSLPGDARVHDARGTLSVAQSMSVIANSDLFIGLDAAPANLVYFLDGVTVDLIVLLGRTDCFTPLRYPPASPGVRLTTVVGPGQDIVAIRPEAVLEAVQWMRSRRRATSQA
jgi:ADP-heptose:LPS heptosyltransferase